MTGTMATIPACVVPCISYHTLTPFSNNNKHYTVGWGGAHCSWRGHLQVHRLKDEVGSWCQLDDLTTH